MCIYGLCDASDNSEKHVRGYMSHPCIRACVENLDVPVLGSGGDVRLFFGRDDGARGLEK